MQATVSGVVTQYVYNADGARVKKTVSGTATYYVGNWYEVTNGVVTKYYYFGAQRVAMKQGSTLTYLHGDHLGSTSVASTQTGTMASRQTYYAFGVPRTTEGTLPTDYTYTGQKNDQSSSLMFYNARYYDAAIGRFTQPDSIIPDQFNPQSLNRYAYVRNNPVRYTDPTGHMEIVDDDSSGSPISAPAQQNAGITYAPAIEDALARAGASPTAQRYINFARTHQVDFIIGWLADDLNNRGGMVTQGNKVAIGSAYAEIIGYGNNGEMITLPRIRYMIMILISLYLLIC